MVEYWKTLIAASGEFCQHSGMLNLMVLLLYGEMNTIGATFKEEDKDKLKLLIAFIGNSKAASSNKHTCASWICYFYEGEEAIEGFL